MMLSKLGQYDEQMRSAGLLLIRVMIGFVFFYHGGQKLFGIFGGYGIEGTAGFFASIGIPFPTLSVYLAGGAEFFGGISCSPLSRLRGNSVA